MRIRGPGPGPFGSEFQPPTPVSCTCQTPTARQRRRIGVPPTGTEADLDRSITVRPDHQTAPCRVEISHDGRYLFAVNTAQPSISSYAIDPDGSLTLLGGAPLAGPRGLAPVDA